MSLVIIYLFTTTMIIGNCLFAIETAAFYSATSTLNRAIVTISLDTTEVIDVTTYALNPEKFSLLLESPMQWNYPFFNLEIAYYFYNQNLQTDCQAYSIKCDGVQIKLQSSNGYFQHQTFLRFEVSIGG